MEKMIKPILSHTDPAFSGEVSGSCFLALEITWDHAAIGVYDTRRSLWVAIENWNFSNVYLPGHLLEKLMQVREASVLLSHAYEKSLLLWSGTPYTLIPQALYQESARREYFTFSQNPQPGDDVFADLMGNAEAMNVYAMPLVLRNGLEQLFPGAVIKHAVSGLCEGLLIRFKNTLPDRHVLINAGDRSFDLVILNKNKLAFCNSFEYKSAEDFTYYVLFVMEQLGIDPRELEVMVCGQMNRPSAVDTLLSKYLRKVTLIPRNAQWKYSYVFDELPGHQFYNLLNILSCV